MRSWVGIVVGKVIKNVSCVVMSACESVSHVLWEYSAYSSSILVKITGEVRHFDALDSLGKSSFILGSGLWEDHFDSLLPLVKDYVVTILGRGSGGIYWD